jgi:hypothetical protein
MNFHLPSFLLGYASGAATVLIGQQLRPLAVEVVAAAYQAADAVAARVAMLREDVDDMLAEARARARGRTARAARGPRRRATA